MAGITWVANEYLALGFAVRTPGAVWLDGSTDFAGEHRDVDPTIQMPTRVFFGITAHPTSRFETYAAVRWTDSSRFGDSDIEFAGLELPFDSQDWKITAGASYALGAWTLHLTGAYQFEEERTIAPTEALLLPGRYSNAGGIVLLGVVYRR